MANITNEEFNAVKERVQELAELENRNGMIIGRCNGTLKSTRRFFMKKFNQDKHKAENCIEWLKDNGGYCNCEILYNVLPIITAYEYTD